MVPNLIPGAQDPGTLPRESGGWRRNESQTSPGGETPPAVKVLEPPQKACNRQSPTVLGHRGGTWPYFPPKGVHT